MKHITQWMMAVALICSAASASAQTTNTEESKSYTVTKISNPDRGEREVDGLMAGGDRENSYTWRLAMRGDEIFIATTRNIASALVNMYAPSFTASGMSLDSFWAIIDAVTNGDIPRNDANEGANIISYNRQTGEFRVVYTGESKVYYRMAVTYGDNVYFGSYSADPNVGQYILKLDKDGNFTKVFETMGSVSLRANCEYDGHLFFAGADDREVIAPGDEDVVAKMAVLRKSNDDDTVWDRVADYRDFGQTAFDPIHTNWAGAPIWELATHNGYIYATAPTHAGFVIYKGHPAAADETANEYGWYWQEVAGPTNGINNPGLSDVEGGELGTMRSLIGSVYEFNGQLYAYNFDHAFGGEASAFAGMMQTLAGQDVKASDYLEYIYNSLQNPQKVWCLNDETGKFEELTNFTALTEGTTNEYIWRMGEYDGQLYIATMDAGIFYNYMTQLTNGSFLNMTLEERLTKLAYINSVIQILLQAKGEELADTLRSMLETLKSFLENYVETVQIDDENVQTIVNFEQLLSDLQSMATIFRDIIIEMIMDALTGDADEQYSDNSTLQDFLQQIMSSLQQALLDLYSKIDIEGIQKYLFINQLVSNNEWGFDLFRTTDGETFEVITRNGFNDKYNYGCSSFLATEEGLYFGTCNPFYGGQLYLLTNESEEGGVTTGITDLHTQANGQSDVWYTINGQRIAKPTKGLYIQNGKVVVVK
ncbi:MAG: hypothetical protein J5552_06705 [Prevotella sp.]|nr:hypothetical protein [Prevotella sp.]